MTEELYLPKGHDPFIVSNQLIGKYCIECRGQICGITTTMHDDGTAKLSLTIEKFPMEKLFVTAVSETVKILQLCELTNLNAWKGLYGQSTHRLTECG